MQVSVRPVGSRPGETGEAAHRPVLLFPLDERFGLPFLQRQPQWKGAVWGVGRSGGGPSSALMTLIAAAEMGTSVQLACAEIFGAWELSPSPCVLRLTQSAQQFYFLARTEAQKG